MHDLGAGPPCPHTHTTSPTKEKKSPILLPAVAVHWPIYCCLLVPSQAITAPRRELGTASVCGLKSAILRALMHGGFQEENLRRRKEEEHRTFVAKITWGESKSANVGHGLEGKEAARLRRKGSQDWSVAEVVLHACVGCPRTQFTHTVPSTVDFKRPDQRPVENGVEDGR